ncbi:hypothetical protein [Sinomonas sp. RB5]
MAKDRKTPKRSRRTYTDLYINMGGGSLVGKDLDLTPEQADRAVEAILVRAQRAVAERRAHDGDPQS